MFVRRLKHKNGRTYIQVVSKNQGKYKVVKSFGSSDSIDEIEQLANKASLWIKSSSGLMEIDFEDEISLFNNLLDNITSHRLVGIDLVLGKIFDEIGFRTKHTIEEAIAELHSHLKMNILENPISNPNYYNVKLLKERNIL